jgi:hypothetical protein
LAASNKVGDCGLHRNVLLFPHKKNSDYPANIAEDFARNERRELLHFLSISAGSLSELDTLIELAARLGYLNNTEELNGKVDEVSGLLMGLSASIKAALTPTPSLFPLLPSHY